MQKIPMTLSGVEKLREELQYLKNIRRSKIIRDITEACNHGDLKENSEYHAAREQQSFCEGRIQEIERKLANAYVIDVTQISPSNKVIFGTTVSIQNLNTEKLHIYKIVGDDEADLKKNLISINSPIARSLVGKKEGETVIVNTPNGDVKYEIIQVQYC